ncbi:hypothetical protein OS493_024847 [Desmophyllum pertusum]|uniref:Uncharacterized protein n=1 Tax=Desmophyllum pertusum TaxID=174260 RepID=A0A9W9YXS6_9CNID|nr:hypothetical protein OS493_024847 [Desmophyllum pertusum]
MSQFEDLTINKEVTVLNDVFSFICYLGSEQTEVGDGSSAGRDPLASGRGQSQGRKRKRRKTSTSSSSTQLPRKPVQRVRVLSYVGSPAPKGSQVLLELGPETAPLPKHGPGS